MEMDNLANTSEAALCVVVMLLVMLNEKEKVTIDLVVLELEDPNSNKI